MEDLKKAEEAAEHYASVTDPEAHGIEFICEVFVAGAEWDREQMMEGAVEGHITNAGGEFGYDVAAFRFDENHTYTVLLPHEEGRKRSDKVRIIIVKED